MLIEIELLDAPLPDLRTVPPTAQEDAAFKATLEAHGILQPLVVRPSAGGRYDVVLGRRRLRFAKELGFAAVPAEVADMTDQAAHEAQAIENTARASMHPIDRWRAVKLMLDAGSTVKAASVAMGLGERETRQMERLAMLAPDVLALAEKAMPSGHELRRIASAPADIQEAALKAPHAVQSGYPTWHLIAKACDRREIHRARAIFDVESSGVAFEEDLFAQPGASDQFVTRDVDGFMAAQRAALEAQVAARAAKGERVYAVEWNGSGCTPALPKGWTIRYDTPPRKALKAKGGPALFRAIRTDFALGEVTDAYADPPAATAPKAEPEDETGNAAPVGAPPPAPVAPEEEKAGLTKAGQTMAAAMKTAAIRQHFDDHFRANGHRHSLEKLATALLVALCADNVKVLGSKFGVTPLRDLLPRLVDPAGRMTVPDDGDLRAMLEEALGRMLVVTDPVSGFGSGRAAEWVANALGVVPPRFDTPLFLAQVGGAALRAAAKEQGVPDLPAKVADLRDACNGAMPGWVPTAFGAPGPMPAAEAAEMTGAEDEAWEE